MSLAKKEFSEQSDRKKWIYSDSETSTLHRQECGPSQRVSAASKEMAWLVFIGWLISYASKWEVIPTTFWEGEVPGFGPPPTAWSFDSALEL